MNKKLLKSITGIIISMLLVASISVSAETNNGTGTTDIEINGVYQAGSVSPEVISADITWGTMEFTYTDASQGTWDPATHQYEGATEAGWTANGNTITVKNHSNVDITADFTFNADANATGITGNFTKNSIELSSATTTAVADAPSDTTDFTVSGAITENKKLGTISITIAKKPELLACGHSVNAAGDHTAGACGTAGHYNCDGNNHYAGDCGTHGHYNCDGNLHGLGICGQ